MAGENEEVKDVTNEEKDFTGLEQLPDPHPSSGMFQYMQAFLGEEDKDEEKADDVAGGNDEEPNADDTDSASLFDRFTDEDNTKFKEVVSKDEFNEEDLKEFNLSEDELKTVKDKYSEKFKVPVGVKLEDMEKEDLINEVKKNQRLVSERNQEVQTLKSQMEQASGNKITDEEMSAFLTDIKTDLKGGWKKHADKLGLPDISLIQASNSNGSVEDRLYQWQQSELRREIEKEFGLEKGEFEVVKEDLYEPKTASYRWRTRTEAKEKELKSEIETQMSTERQRLTKIQEQQQNEIKWYADTYTDGDITKAQEIVKEMNTIPEKIAKGELKPDRHPFALKNLLLGYKHEEIVNAKVKEAIDKVTKQFNDKGIYLKSEDEMPTDITNVKSPKSGKTKLEFDKQTIERSPMLRNVNELLNL
jgi:hypothetical protein